MKKVAIYNLSEFQWEKNSLAGFVLENQHSEREKVKEKEKNNFHL